MPNLAGQKTFLNIQQETSEVLLNKSIATSSDKPNLARIKQVINDSYRKILAEGDWWFLFNKDTFSSVVGQTTAYAMPDKVQEVFYMAIPANQQRLRYLPWEEWVAGNYPGRYTNVGNTRPWSYVPGEPATNGALQFYLFPAPDAVYSVEYGYKNRPADMSADGDIPVITPEFQDVLVNLSISDCFHHLNDNRWMEWKAKYDDRLQRMWLYDQYMPDYAHIWRNLNREMVTLPQYDINRSLFGGV